MGFSITLTLDAETAASMKESAKLLGKTPRVLLRETIEAIFSAKCAQIILTPKPSSKQTARIKEAIADILKDSKVEAEVRTPFDQRDHPPSFSGIS
jgi:flagellar basal body-associated protein FliL